MQHVYCIGLIEGDILIYSGLSRIIKDRYPESRVTLLLPDHPRAKGKLDQYFQYFDAVKEFEYHTFTRNPVTAFRTVRRYVDLFEMMEFPAGSIFFSFDIYELPDLVLYYFLNRKHRGEYVYVTVSAFECNEYEKERREAVLSGTFIQSLVSFPLLGKIFWEYQIKNTEYRWLRYLVAEVDVQLCVMKSRFRNIAARYHHQLPYPPAMFMQEGFSHIPKVIGHSNTVLLLLNSQLDIHLSDYQAKIARLIETIHVLVPKGHIYIKDHPNYKGEPLNSAGLEYVTVLKNSIPAEQIYLNEGNSIGAVVAYGTTSLITASWLGIQAVHISEYLGFSGPVTAHYNDFMTFGEHIVNLKELSGLNGLELTGANRVTMTKEMIIGRWSECLAQISDSSRAITESL